MGKTKMYFKSKFESEIIRNNFSLGLYFILLIIGIFGLWYNLRKYWKKRADKKIKKNVNFNVNINFD